MDQRRSRPATWFPARLRAGARLSPEKAGGKSAGGLAPWTPFFYGPLVATRSFWRLCRIVPVFGLLRSPSTCPDLGTFFRKNAFQHIFSGNAFQIGLSIPEGIAPLSYQRQRSPKRASESERAIKPGVQGACPRPSFSPFLGRNGDPAGQAGPPGRCAPRHRKSPDHPKGTQYPTAPPPGPGREPTPQGPPCAGPNGTAYR